MISSLLHYEQPISPSLTSKAVAAVDKEFCYSFVCYMVVAFVYRVQGIVLIKRVTSLLQSELQQREVEGR